MLSAPRKKSETTSWPPASCTAKVGMVHTKATHGKNSFELSVAVCVSALRGRCHCCVRLRVYILVRVPSSMVLRDCVSVCVCVRVCQFCKTRKWSHKVESVRNRLAPRTVVVVPRPTTPCSETKELYLFEESCVWKTDAT